MCGIAGIVTRDGHRPDEGQLRGLSQAIAHRGPDADGIQNEPGCGLVHRRLSIIDLSPLGAQPMVDQSGRYWIVFNGEIYNFQDVRKELEAKGSQFRSHSDTEVLLEGYRQWGIELLPKLRGMFAFALWDTQKKELLLARDRIGKKPLFFSKTEKGDVLFASELKAFSSVMSMEPDWEAIRLFLGLQYVPSPRTGFKGIEQLMPGSYAIFKNGELTQKKYHQWNRQTLSLEHNPSRTELREGEPEGVIRSLLEESVRLRQLASDVPVGAFLSGGIDSAAVVAFASKQLSKPLKTFTMGFDVKDMDERSEAQELAKAFGTDHSEFLAKPSDLLQLADKLVAHYDAPYADSSALPVWLLAEQTAKQVKVVLTGDGGDELFGGYRRYLHFLRGIQLAKTPIGGWLGTNMRRIGTWYNDTDVVRMGRLIEAIRQRPKHAYGELFTGAYFDSFDLHRIFRPEFLEQTKQFDAVEFVASQTSSQDASLDDAMFFDLTSYLPDDLNVKMDRATMRWGLEARAPFLDQELVQFALSLPLKEKVDRGKTKVILKRALQGIVPENCLTRPKRGFQVPLAEWFKGPLKQAFADRCLDPQGPLSRMTDIEAVKRLAASADKGADHGNRMWMLYALASWLERYA